MGDEAESAGDRRCGLVDISREPIEPDIADISGKNLCADEGKVCRLGVGEAPGILFSLPSRFPGGIGPLWFGVRGLVTQPQVVVMMRGLQIAGKAGRQPSGVPAIRVGAFFVLGPEVLGHLNGGVGENIRLLQPAAQAVDNGMNLCRGEIRGLAKRANG